MLIILLKMFVSVAMVLTLTMVAEKVGPRLAGVLIGFPLWNGLAIFFYGLEQGAEFTAKSAIWAIPGVLAALTFAYVYARFSQFSRKNGIAAVSLCSLVAISAFFSVSALLQIILPESGLGKLVVCLCGVVMFICLFRPFPQKVSLLKVPSGLSVLVGRAIFTALIVTLVTGIAHIVGSNWAGLLATFPVVLYPIAAIIHYQYDSEAVRILFRGFPFGIIAIVVFDYSVALTYPTLGVWLGFFISYLVAFLYLVFYEFVLRKRIATWF